ncbi:hypothetical protein C672_3665 [[Clostridium] bifermentans ATCC 638]|uniref:Uncharacterized protein n=1 Tax=Paraclostridium bifermentans ATCC 638 = DSM 14991 TaxID=1233171 RepID=T4VF48_PARBF|nr:hypothetical protein [Paraclostridium bifermentans]EQK39740.1 hypothetical protein C672_3665 [[Clostridium] bifermentans ATCC 638] [Paraclostridium bifermentans ATCC 638 = DSM 14991]
MAKVSTVKLGAYPASLTLEFFEEQGYVKYKDLDKYFGECFNELETYLDKESFIKNSKRNLLNSVKYKQFLNDEVKMCSKCFKVKPLNSYYNQKEGLFGKRSLCTSCDSAIAKDYRSTEVGKKTLRKASSKYYLKNKEFHRKINREWRKKNKELAKSIQNRSRMKKKLKLSGYIVEDASKLDFLVSFKQENNIMYYDDLFKRLEGILNDYRV